MNDPSGQHEQPLAAMGTDALGLLDQLGIDSFEYPVLFAVLALAIFASLVVRLRARPQALPWPGLDEALLAGARRSDPMRTIGVALRGATLLALAAVLAGPIGIHRAPPEPGFGLDIVLVVDTSESMSALDAQVAGESRTRLDLAREVVSRFAQQRVSRGDRVGLVVFGETAFTLCPLTGDGDLLAASLSRIEVGAAGSATALGDALGLAVKRALGGVPAKRASRAPPVAELVQSLSEGMELEQLLSDPEPLLGRVVVLLTDGRNNAGSVPLDVATSLAVSTGIRVHTVGIGTSGGEVRLARGTSAKEFAAANIPTPRFERFERHDVDREALEEIARATRGQYFEATRSIDLDAVYREIDSLERLERRLPPRIRHTERPEPLLAIALGFAMIEIASTRVFARRTP